MEGSHNVVGLHPRLDLPKLWFFPGVTDRTGGVLIEDDYEKRQQAFALQKKDFLLELGADPQRTTVFIFTYPVNDLQTAAAALRQAAANRPMNALLAPGEAGDMLEKLLSGAGSELRTVRTPFVAQRISISSCGLRMPPLFAARTASYARSSPGSPCFGLLIRLKIMRIA